MYEGALPKTGLAVGIAGATFLPWIITVGVALVLGGFLLTRYTRKRSHA